MNVLLIVASVCRFCLYNPKPWGVCAQCLTTFWIYVVGSVIVQVLFRLSSVKKALNGAVYLRMFYSTLNL